MSFIRKFLQEHLSLSTKLFLKQQLGSAQRLGGRFRGHPSTPRRGPAYSGQANQRPPILVCDERIPSPDRDAGSARMFLILETLTRSYRVIFLVFNRPHGIEYEEALWKIGIETGNASDYKWFLKQENIRVAILSRPAIADALLAPVRRAAANTKIVYDMLDVHHLRATREAELTGDLRAKHEAAKLKRIETRLARKADLIWCGSLPDQEIMRQIAPDTPSVVVPTLHELHSRSRAFAERRNLLFVGSFSHRPNEDAIHFFAREVMPLLRRTIPDLELLVAGGNAPSSFENYAEHGVRVLGYVPDLDPVFASARVFVAPIRFGSGVNGKIGEAQSYGIPVVTTTIGAEGWEFIPGVQALIADSPHNFAESVLRLYQDCDLWHRVSDAGYHHIAENYTPAVLGKVILESVQELSRQNNVT